MYPNSFYSCVAFFVEPFSAVVQEPSSLAKDDLTTSRKRKLNYSPEGVTAKKIRKLSPRSSNPLPLDSDSGKMIITLLFFITDNKNKYLTLKGGSNSDTQEDH